MDKSAFDSWAAIQVPVQASTSATQHTMMRTNIFAEFEPTISSIAADVILGEVQSSAFGSEAEIFFGFR
jgi:hypothetical protein